MLKINNSEIYIDSSHCEGYALFDAVGGVYLTMNTNYQSDLGDLWKSCKLIYNLDLYDNSSIFNINTEHINKIC